ncbi:AAA family ATPase [Hymenobacter crusticola]|uniref:NadR/Ttd14 AAA domain-containing protein n=1 Tax=Hymenobacter crusticola TaxID=1770526 RepID=A0A243WK66_9BACT|nr:AAA family ATPase [Hymenobacter crusticola]OUJ76298.1 hypothetical protein BXP70_03325 [Hymenobacter crusticola]
MPLYVISGGPGAGKTTLLTALQQAGFGAAEEVSRQLIREQVALGTDQVPWRDLAGFAELAMARMVVQHQAASQSSRTIFFDRGIPDVIGYMRVAGLAVPPAYYTTAAAYSYASPVLLAPPWAEIYVNDAERWQTFAEAQALYHTLRRTYQDLGFTVLDLPKVSVDERVAFVRKVVAT